MVLSPNRPRLNGAGDTEAAQYHYLSLYRMIHIGPTAWLRKPAFSSASQAVKPGSSSIPTMVQVRCTRDTGSFLGIAKRWTSVFS